VAAKLFVFLILCIGLVGFSPVKRMYKKDYYETGKLKAINLVIGNSTTQMVK